MAEIDGERVAICIEDGGLCEWQASRLAALCDADLPFGQSRNEQIINDAACLLDQWGKKIDSNLWGPDDIAALIPLICGARIIKLTDLTATLQGDGGEFRVLNYRPSATGKALWTEGRREREFNDQHA